MVNAEQGVRGNTTGSRIGAARAALWLVAALLAARQAADALTRPPGGGLTDPATWAGPGGFLQVSGSLYDGGGFTGTPFAGLVLGPFADSAQQSPGVIRTFGTLLLVVAIGLVVSRSLPVPVSRRSTLPAAPVAVTLLMLSLPVRDSFHPGQTGVVPVLLVLLGCLAARGERSAGLLVGLGAALQPTALLFAPLLWFTGRRRAAVGAAGTFAGLTALAWSLLPGDSWSYWTGHVAGAGLGAGADSPAGQSLYGALLRLGVEGPPKTALWAVLCAAVVVLGLRRAVRYARDGQPLLAVAITGCAAVGRVGSRAGDRRLWPVLVVLVSTLPGSILLPDLVPLHPLRDNVPLAAALAAACAVPFLRLDSPHFGRPVPTEYARPAPARWAAVPLLPFWRRALSRPNLLLELLVIRAGYSVYSHIRAAATGGADAAEGHARQVLAVERALGIDIEHGVNHLVAGVPWAEAFFDFYYTSFHFTVPLAVLGVLYVRRPADFRWARTSLAFATLLALLGFWLYPLAPPRLMPGLGFIDTVHGPQDLAHPDYGAMTAVTNQYAAMPSLHFGWSLWCGLVVLVLAPKLWTRLLGLLHPVLTLCAIVATANHWVLDAVGGAVVVGAGFGLVHVLAGRRQLHIPPRSVPPARAGGTTDAAGPADAAGGADMAGGADAAHGAGAAGATGASRTRA